MEPNPKTELVKLKRRLNKLVYKMKCKIHEKENSKWTTLYDVGRIDSMKELVSKLEQIQEHET
jgi:hypothetical protein